MSALVLDAGALVAVDRNDRAMVARLRVAQQQQVELRSHAMVVAQVWRNADGRQAPLARVLRAVDVRTIDESLGRQAGVLLARTRTDDPIDATVVLIASNGDRVLTSDPDDLRRLATTAGKRIAILAC